MEAHITPWEFHVKSLSALVGAADAERLLCPVRAFIHYLSRTYSATNRGPSSSRFGLHPDQYPSGPFLLPPGRHQGGPCIHTGLFVL